MSFQRHDIRILNADPDKERIDGLRKARSLKYLGRTSLLIGVLSILLAVAAESGFFLFLAVILIIAWLILSVCGGYYKARFKE